ncbi:GDSL lipase/esterase [Halteromyces radiatus]|uniref:GDSL lipase/esterase n=1 Tax=Halteromyces radiatus TaxID=101107 RepID=UPI00221F21A7|nr:GDSL lipase/esterase [Halteromyces radiatus]KAI8096485.1 GDSL lipase/esterase [Halteromyces radiatus]
MPTIHHRRKQSFDLENIKTHFAFGDSYTTNYLDLPTMSYPDYNNVSSTNGRNWVNYFTQTLHLTKWDLAYNSAPVQNTLVNQDPNVIDVNKQIIQLFPEYFLQNDATWSKESTLYSIWVGINDVGLLLNNPITSLDVIIHRYRQLIDSLYDNNARNLVLINVPPIDKSPKWAPPKTASKMRALVKEFNEKIEQMVNDVVDQYHDGHFYLIDAWSIFTRILDNPNEYGFGNVTGYCPDWRQPEEHDCQPIAEYFWLNDLHPTTKVHAHFAQALLDTLQKV